MIRFAIYGPGKISHRIMEGFRYVDGARVTAFCTRDPGKVRDYAREYGVEKLLSHDELMADETIDAVYVATPTYLHFEHIKACLEAGKHVISEKPITVTTEQLKYLYKLAEDKHLMVMEAQKGLFLPVFQKIREWLKDERIGKIQLATADFSRPHDIPDDHPLYNLPGGGAIYDVGCYPLSELLGLFPLEDGEVIVHPIYRNGIPETAVITISDPERINMVATCSHRVTGSNDLCIYGDKGQITCHEFWKARECTLVNAEGVETFREDYESEFSFEIRHFVECINKDLTSSPINTPEQSIKVTGILEMSAQ